MRSPEGMFCEMQYFECSTANTQTGGQNAIEKCHCKCTCVAGMHNVYMLLGTALTC